MFNYDIYQFPIKEDKQKSISNREKIESLLDYAENLGVKIISRQKLLKEIMYNEEGKKRDLTPIPKKEVLDGLMKEWKIWKRYVSPESFNSFMLEGIKSILLIHGNATTSVKSLKGYVGNKAMITCVLPLLSTSVNKKGELFLNGKLVEDDSIRSRKVY